MDHFQLCSSSSLLQDLGFRKALTWETRGLTAERKIHGSPSAALLTFAWMWYTLYLFMLSWEKKGHIIKPNVNGVEMYNPPTKRSSHILNNYTLDYGSNVFGLSNGWIVVAVMT